MRDHPFHRNLPVPVDGHRESALQSEARAGDTPHDTASHMRLVASEWRAAWRPGIAALIGGSLAFSIYGAVSSLFVEPLQHQFGWTRGQIAAVHGFGLVTAFSGPVIGIMIDRYGVRPVLLIALVLTAIGYGLLSLMQGSLTYYYAVYFFFTVVGPATSGLSFTRIITGAFTRTRGTALAMIRMGLATSGALMPLVLFPVIARYGSAGGYLLLGALILLVTLPLVWFWVPSKAADLASGRSKAGLVSDGWRLLLRAPKVRIVILAAVLNYAPVLALASQLKPLAVSKGLDAAMAVGALTVMGLAAAAGALISGVLIDRFWAPAVACVMNLLPAIGCLVLLPHEVSPMVLYGAMLLIGLGQGAENDIIGFMIARYFGLRSYGTIFGLTALGITLGVSFAASMIGQAYDRFGNYNIALMAASASFALAAISYLAMGRYPQDHPE